MIFPIYFGALLIFITLSISYGVNVEFGGLNSTDSWLKSDAPTSTWLGVVSDNSGKRLAAVSTVAGKSMTGVYLSSDSGKTWTNVFINGCGAYEQWTGIAMSSDGYTIYALQQNMGVFVSTNGGSYWTRYMIDTTLYSPSWNNIACSSDGVYVYVTLNGGAVYVSNNFGRTFTKTSAPLSLWTSMTTSSTGQYVLAITTDVYISSNYGSTWTKANVPVLDFYVAHFSGDGKNVVMAAVGGPSSYHTYGGIYLSADYGRSWTLSPSTDRYLAWRTVTSDYTGQKIVAAVSGGDIYTSTDQGKTFQKSSTAPSGESWRAITCDFNCLNAAVAGYNGNIYYGIA